MSGPSVVGSFAVSAAQDDSFLPVLHDGRWELARDAHPLVSNSDVLAKLAFFA
jgi:hypothetical protein